MITTDGRPWRHHVPGERTHSTGRIPCDCGRAGRYSGGPTPHPAVDAFVWAAFLGALVAVLLGAAL